LVNTLVKLRSLVAAKVEFTLLELLPGVGSGVLELIVAVLVVLVVV
jgi:hypothetical protein